MKCINIAYYAGDNTPYFNTNVPDVVKSTLKMASLNVFQWFYNNRKKADIDKCHFLSSLGMTSKMTIEIFSIKDILSKTFRSHNRYKFKF